MDKPLMLSIAEIVDENPFVKTFYFDYPLRSQPGQFVLLWIPRVDQKPFSIGYDNGQRFGLTIFQFGALTEKLFSMKLGDRVGITGPYGTSFTVRPNTQYITVAGGYGAGPLGVLAELAGAVGSRVDFCVGAKHKDLLLFEERMSRLSHVKLAVATDDGSKGHKGYVTDLLEAKLQEYRQAPPPNQILVCTCGPELMEKRVLDLCNEFDVACEISIERYIKCGFNVCGQCCVDNTGLAMCTQGPVVSREVANRISEFGKYHRDKSGKRISY